MKKLFLLTTITGVLMSFATMAQSGFGIKGGIALNNITTNAGSFKDNINQSLDTKTGYVFGVFGRLGDKVFLQPELLVASKGGKVNITPTNGSTPVAVDVKYTNLDIPILVGIKPISRIRLMAGPVISLKLSEDQKLKDALAVYTNGNSNDALKTASWGYQVGVGVKILGIEVDLRRVGSISEIAALKLNNDAKFSSYAQGWQLTLGLKII